MTTHPARGIKYTCTGCATRFYDLNKQPATCPKCQQKVAIVVKAPRRARRRAGDSTPADKNALTSQVAIVTEPKAKPRHVRWK